MKQSFIPIIFFLLSISAHSQTDTNNLLKLLQQIKDVPNWYTSSYQYKSGKEDSFEGVDSVYKKVVKSTHISLLQLASLLSDTTLTNISNTCNGGHFTFGQLAFFLINDIEPTPYAIVTNQEWHVFGECGILPTYFLSYIKSSGHEFENKYKVYLQSKERKNWLKLIGKRKKRSKKIAVPSGSSSTLQ